MKRFHFQLEKLLRYHQQRQKQAELALSRAGLVREAAHAEKQRLERAIRATCELSERVGQPIAPALREQSLQHAQQLCETLQQAQESLKAAEQRFREAQSQYTAVTQQVEALLHLRLQRWEEHQDEVARREQIDLDAAVMMQWSRKMLVAAAPTSADAPVAME